MGRQIRLLIGISVFWLALSVLFDGVNTLVLPLQLSALSDQNNQATILGLFTFVGLLTGALIQPVAGAFSDRLQPFPASKLFHGGFERPSHCQFGPDGNLYIVDFGIIHIAPERGVIRRRVLQFTLIFL
jgi:MFS family permease